MVTTFNRGRVRYTLLASPRARRDWEVALDAILPEPSLWSARDDAQGRGGQLKDHPERRAKRLIAPKTHYSDKGRKR